MDGSGRETRAGNSEGRRTISAEETEPADEAGVEPATVARVNVALIKESAEALVRLQKDTGLKKVDIVNRAIQLYEFIAAELGAKRQVVVRGDDGHEVLVKIFM